MQNIIISILLGACLAGGVILMCLSGGCTDENGNVGEYPHDTGDGDKIRQTDTGTDMQLRHDTGTGDEAGSEWEDGDTGTGTGEEMAKDTDTGTGSGDSETETAEPHVFTRVIEDCHDMRDFFSSCYWDVDDWTGPAYQSVTEKCAGKTVTDLLMRWYYCWTLPKDSCDCPETNVSFECQDDKCRQWMSCMTNCW